MSKNRKEYFLYPAITAVVISGINAFADWRRGTLESIWWYVIAALTPTLIPPSILPDEKKFGDKVDAKKK